MPCNTNRLVNLMKILTHNTVLGAFIKPAIDALEYVRFKPGIFKALTMEDFITLGVLRHIKGQTTLRDQIQELFHLDPVDGPPLARSTWSDAMASVHRRDILRGVIQRLQEVASRNIADRLENFSCLAGRSVYAVDGTYQKESCHYRKITPRQGGKDNPKGHGLLTFFDARLGCPVDVVVQTDTTHEVNVLKSSKFQGLSEKNALFLVDRGFIDASFWNSKKTKYGITMISRMKTSLVVESSEEQPVAATEENQGVLKDEHIILRSGGTATWRRITYCAPNGQKLIFLTNELIVEPGMIAFLFLRRWDEEKCFDTWKNDLSASKAWGYKKVSIENQALLAIVTSLLIAIFLHEHAESYGIKDEKALTKQEKRLLAESKSSEGERPASSHFFPGLFRFTSKVSKQVIRFFKGCFLKTMDYELLEVEFWPLLKQYL